MAFPAENIRAEMLINGTWTEVTSRVRGSGDIRIASGTRIDSTDLAPTTVDFILNNRDGLFSNDNPMSAYYGLLPINTNVRMSMEEATPFVYLRNEQTYDVLVDGFSQYDWISTADKAVLDVTGDLDIRMDFLPDTWQRGGVGCVLAGKWETLPSAQRSWAWTIESSGLTRFWWSTGGTLATTFTATSTAVVPAVDRISLRVTMDVNNGAGGNTVTFYTSDSVTGTWTQLGAPIVASGTTSIFSSSSGLALGNTSLNSDSFALATTPPCTSLVGRIYRFQMYNGIAGTLVADMNATAQAEGTSSWSDGLGTPNTWSVAGGAVTVADCRACAEMSDMPQSWDVTGQDVMVGVSAAGVSRRITKDPKVLQSAFRRFNENLPTPANVTGYWAMEDPSGSVTAFSSIAGSSVSGFNDMGFGSQYRPFGSDALADVSSTDSFITFKFARNAAAGWALGWVARYQPFTDNPLPLLLTADTIDGTDYVVTLDVASKIIEVFAQTPSGVILGDVTTTYTDDWGEWHSFALTTSQSGGNIQMTLYWRGATGAAWKSITTTFAGTCSPLTQSQFNGGDVPPGSTVGHVLGYAGPGSAAALIGSDRFSSFNGWISETAAHRWLRVCRENGIRGLMIGLPADTQMMGPQPIATVADILDECAATDGAIQYDARDQIAIVFRSRASLYAQQPLALDYAQAHLSGNFQPVDDDMLTRNYVTAANPDGSYATIAVTTGPKSTLSSPNGVGTYNASVAVNTDDLAGLVNVAADAALRGTWPGRRVPNVTVQLVRPEFTQSASLTRSVRGVDLGDRVTVANVPLWVGGGTADMVIRQYTETIQNSAQARGWGIDWATVPGGPFSSVPMLGHDLYVPRLDANLNVTGGALTTTATSVTLVTPAGSSLFVDSANYPAEFPFTVNIDGEWITITAISGTSSPQTATLTRSVNGIVKTHSAGATVRLAAPYYVGR